MSNTAIKYLVDKYYAAIVSPAEQRLFDLAFAAAPTQAEVDIFLRDWDIEVKNMSALMLSYFMRAHPELKFTEYETPRLRGLLDRWRFSNLEKIANFAKVAKALNAAKIPLLLMRGGAMKYLRPELSRTMGDVDFLVPTDRLDAAVDAALAQGFKCKYFEREKNLDRVLRHQHHAVDLVDADGKDALDIHRLLFAGCPNGEQFTADLLARAYPVTAFGAEVLLPADEDFVFMLLINVRKNLAERTSLAGVLFTLFDIKFFLDRASNFNWQQVLDDARQIEAEPSLKLVIAFIRRVAPAVLPADLSERIPLSPREKFDLERQVFDELYFTDVSLRRGQLRWKGLVRELKLVLKKFGQYFADKFHFALYKRVRRSPRLTGYAVRRTVKGDDR
ncbi:MAG: nucleotidyltransferase family protein [Planctomycetota bacterium]|jgi:hypothetical protein|nr:nucleotidyltransferase family protein [Planctomycetota bacterium]